MPNLLISGTASGKSTGFNLIKGYSLEDIIYVGAIASSANESVLTTRIQHRIYAGYAAAVKLAKCLHEGLHYIRPQEDHFKLAWYQGWWRFLQGGTEHNASFAYLVDDLSRTIVVLLDKKFNVLNVSKDKDEIMYHNDAADYMVLLKIQENPDEKPFFEIKIEDETYGITDAFTLISGKMLYEVASFDSRPHDFDGRPLIYLWEAGLSGAYQSSVYVKPGIYHLTIDNMAETRNEEATVDPVDELKKTFKPISFGSSIEELDVVVNSTELRSIYDVTAHKEANDKGSLSFLSRIMYDESQPEDVYLVWEKSRAPLVNTVFHTNGALIDSGNGYRLVSLDENNDVTAPGAIRGAFLLCLSQTNDCNSILSIVPWSIPKDFLANGDMDIQGFSDGVVFVARYAPYIWDMTIKVVTSRATDPLATVIALQPRKREGYRDLGCIYSTTRKGSLRGFFTPISDQKGNIFGNRYVYRLDHKLSKDELEELSCGLIRNTDDRIASLLQDSLLIPSVNCTKGDKLWPENTEEHVTLEELRSRGKYEKGVVANRIHAGSINDAFSFQDSAVTSTADKAKRGLFDLN